jgi:hypothetical protein
MTEIVLRRDRCATDVFDRSTAADVKVSSESIPGRLTKEESLTCAWTDSKSDDERPFTASITIKKVNFNPMDGLLINEWEGSGVVIPEVALGIGFKLTLQDPMASEVY